MINGCVEKNIVKNSMLASAVVFFVVLGLTPAIADAQQFVVEPSRGTVSIEEVLDIKIYVEAGDIDVRAFGFTLDYPEDLVSVPVVTLNKAVSPLMISLSSEAEGGEIKISGVRLSGEYLDPYQFNDDSRRFYVGSVKFISATGGKLDFELKEAEIYSDNVLSYNHAEGEVEFSFNNPEDNTAPAVGVSLTAGFGDNWFFREINRGMTMWQLILGALVMLLGIAWSMQLIDRRRIRQEVKRG